MTMSIHSVRLHELYGWQFWKHWPMHAEKNGTALLRIDGVVYRITLQRTKDPELLRPVMGELARKYMSVEPPLDAMLNEVESNNLWVFELIRRQRQPEIEVNHVSRTSPDRGSHSGF